MVIQPENKIKPLNTQQQITAYVDNSPKTMLIIVLTLLTMMIQRENKIKPVNILTAPDNTVIIE